MGSVKRNITANFAGSAWVALMSLAFVPFYIRLMGIESYGIVGVLISLQALFAVLDLGLSQTLAREMARLSVDPKNSSLLADAVRTFEVIYWGLALGVAATIAILAHSISHYWLNPEQLAPDSLQKALWIMALVVGLRWPVALYMGGLNGLQRQVLVNAVLAIFATVQGVGALAVLWFIEPTVQAFFWWQALIALLQVAVLRAALRSNLRSERDGAFRLEVLKGTWRFAAGMTGISLLVTLLTQLDKVLLSKLLALSDFGYYVFATTVAAVLFRLINPVFTAYSPRLTELVSRDNQPELVRTYHQGCQVMAMVILAPTLTLAVFSKEILELWTHDPALVAGSQMLVSLLVIGNALNGLVTVPYALQLAHGWTKLALYANLIAVAILVPAIYLATSFWGAIGAAWVWVLLNGSYVLIGIHVMHRRWLSGEKWRWYTRDVGMPLLAVLFVVGAGHLLMAENWSAIAKALMLLVVGGLAFAAAALSADSLRHRLVPRLFWTTR